MWHNLILLIFVALYAAASAVHGVEMDHSTMNHGAMEHGTAEPAPMDHAKMNMDAPPLPMLVVTPASGKAREVGFDDTELMEPTSADASLAVQCAQASRGLIAVDRATWAQCTGKSAAPDVPAARAPEHQGH